MSSYGNFVNINHHLLFLLKTWELTLWERLSLHVCWYPPGGRVTQLSTTDTKYSGDLRLNWTFSWQIYLNFKPIWNILLKCKLYYVVIWQHILQYHHHPNKGNKNEHPKHCPLKITSTLQNTLANKITYKPTTLALNLKTVQSNMY